MQQVTEVSVSVAEDPTESSDVAADFPDMVDQIKARLDQYRTKMVPAQIVQEDKNSKPKKYGGVWSPGWC